MITIARIGEEAIWNDDAPPPIVADQAAEQPAIRFGNATDIFTATGTVHNA
jgi:hypothetical protein